MTVYLLFYDKDTGSREDWNTFYTPVEVFSTQELRDKREDELMASDHDLEFYTCELEVQS